MLLELGRHRAIDGPVPAVVRPHRQLVHEQLASVGFEQLDGQHAHHTELTCYPQRELLRGLRELGIQAWRRSQHLDADAVTLHRLHHRPRRTLTEWGACHQHGQFPAHRHALLDQQGSARGEQFCHDPAARLRVTQHPQTPAVITAAGRLEHARPALLCTERDGIGRLDHFAKRRNRQTQPSQRPAHHQLVLGVAQRVRSRVHPNALRNQGPQVFGGHVLMVEGEHVTALSEAAKRRQILVTSDHHIGGHQGRGIRGRGS
jgi:hypothetical protein